MLQPRRRACRVTHSRYTSIEGRSHARNSFQQSQRRRRDQETRNIGILHRQVNMTIDESRQDATLLSIDHCHVLWNRDVTPHSGDALTLDEYSYAFLYAAASVN